MDLIDTFRDVKVWHAFYPLFEKWYVEDNKALKKLSDIGISLKRHIFVDNSQCTELMKFVAKVSSFPFDSFFTYCLLCSSLHFNNLSLTTIMQLLLQSICSDCLTISTMNMLSIIISQQCSQSVISQFKLQRRTSRRL